MCRTTGSPAVARQIDTTARLPRTNDHCVREIGRLTRAMGAEFTAHGCSARWEELGTRLAKVKEHRLKLLGKGT